jgi:cyclic pyranopterin phosphate synthase
VNPPGSATPDSDGPSDGETASFTHLDERGRARMVDVTAKPETARRAMARCVVRAMPEAVERAAKGDDALETWKATGVAGAKLLSSLVPLCHPLPLDGVSVDIDVGRAEIQVSAVTTVVARTGVEMEALGACAAAALSALMHLLPFDPSAVVTTLGLWQKSGGRSGTWERRPAAG